MYQDLEKAYEFFLEFDQEKWSKWIFERIHGYDSQIDIPIIDSEPFPETPITDIYDHLVREDEQEAISQFSRGLKLSLKNDISRSRKHYHDNREFTEEQIFSLELHLRIISHFSDQELDGFTDNVFRKNFEVLINDIYLDIFKNREHKDLRKTIINLSSRISNGIINREILEKELEHIEVTRFAFNYLLQKEKITSFSTYFPIFVKVCLEKKQAFLVKSELSTIKHKYLERFPGVLSEQLSKALRTIQLQSLDNYHLVKKEIENLGLPLSRQIEEEDPWSYINQKDSGISVLERIKLTLSEPPSLFRSYAYFIFRTAKQLGLVNNEEDSFKLLEDIFIKAVTTVTLIEQFNRFFNKPHFMNNPMVFIRWVSYSILLNRATIKIGTGTKIDNIDPKKVKKVQYGILIISNAAGMLEDEITEDFHILMLRYQQGSNWDMIQRIFEEQGKKYDKKTLIRKSKHALSCVRKAFHEEFGEFDENAKFLKIYPDKKDFVVTYYKLGLKPCLNKEIVTFGNKKSYGKAEDINVIYSFILRSNQNSWLDYWFSEIDHILSHVNDINESLPRKRLNQLIEQLSSKIDNHIEPLQNTLKIKLKSFGKDSEKQAIGRDGNKRKKFYDFSTPKYYKLVDELHEILLNEIGYELKYEHWNQNSNGHGFVPINCLNKENIEKYDQDLKSNFR